jgi:RNA polymerase sigma factor (sigma-70 family)
LQDLADRDRGDTQDWVRRVTRGIARGDRGALAELYEAWFDGCYAEARRVTRRDESFCLDVVQETMMRAIRGMRPLASSEQLHAWMKRAVHNAAIDMLRNESRRVRREGTWEGAATGSALGSLEEQLHLVREALARLPAEDAGLIGLRIAKDRTLEATGLAAGITADAAHGRIRRALHRLRGWMLEERHEHNT